MGFRSIRSLDVAGRRVFVRVDFNAPLAPDGTVADDTRIVATLPTLRYLIEQRARLILASHLGRPRGKRDPGQSLRAVAKRLEKFLRQPVAMADAIVGSEAEAAAAGLADGQVLLLENLRFDPGEEANDPDFSRALARLADVYVNDAFGAAHRAHASTEGMTAFVADRAAGFLMEKELSALGRLLKAPEAPFIAILGGAKISGKIDVLQNLLPRVDRLVIGGGMMFTFLRAMGLETGNSLVETERVDMARAILDGPGADKVLLAVDCRVAHDISGADPGSIVGVDAIPMDLMGVDIGSASIDAISAALAEARTILWNGPMGVFEVPAYAEGTRAVARDVARATKRGAFTVIGGGDSLAAVHQAGLEHQISHCSTGGGASLEFLEGRTLPGVAALEREPAARS